MSVLSLIFSTAILLVAAPQSAEASIWHWLGIYDGLSMERRLDYRGPSVGSPFSRSLAARYHIMTSEKLSFDLHEVAEKHIGRKSLMAQEGDTPIPEPFANWGHGSQNLQAARSLLIRAFNDGVRNYAPQHAADAQASFDCWLLAENGYAARTMIDVCQRDFFVAMEDIRYAQNQMLTSGDYYREVLAQRQAREDARIEAERQARLDRLRQRLGRNNASNQNDNNRPDIPLGDAKYLIFFDFDKANIDDSAEKVITATAAEVGQRDDVNIVRVAGHADTVGTEEYNRKLSFKRANNVREALSEKGLDKNRLRIRAMGENDLMVQTPDDTREPANRRVEITFE